MTPLACILVSLCAIAVFDVVLVALLWLASLGRPDFQTTSDWEPDPLPASADL